METVSVRRQATEEDYEELYQNRLELKWDMQAAIACFNNREKIELVKQWRNKYSERKVEELIRFAKNKKVCWEIAHWDVKNFKRTRK